MTEITFVDKMITILASVERFLWIVDKLACDPFPARHKYRKLHRVLSGHRAAFNKTAEWNLHLFLPPCHHGEALWRLLFTKRLEMALFNHVEPSVCVWGHACAFITERVCVWRIWPTVDTQALLIPSAMHEPRWVSLVNIWGLSSEAVGGALAC